MVIEEIINELDKFITKYKERKDGAEKGISLRNNIKQALTEKGVQGADTLDDSSIVERIKTLSFSGNTAVGGTQGNNSVNDSFAQKVIQILKDKHIPYLNSSEDNIELFKQFLKTQKIESTEKLKSISVQDGVISVSIYVPNGFGANVKYVSNGKQHEEVIYQRKQFDNVTSISYRECDYYGAYVEPPQKVIYLDQYRVQINNPNNYIVEFDKNPYSGEVESLVDNSNYDILDTRDKNFYKPVFLSAAKKSKYEYYNENYIADLKRASFNGEIKIAIVGGETSSEESCFGFQNDMRDALKHMPKYIVYKPGWNSMPAHESLACMGKYVDIETDHDATKTQEEYHAIEEKVKETGNVIYKWNESKQKYMIESAETLEEWLKTHPIETL